MSGFLSYLRYRLYAKAVSPLFYFASFAFNLFCAVEFFIFSGFFSGAGGGRHHFFMPIPYACILLLPALCRRSTEEDRLCPLASEKRIAICVCAALIEFAAMFIPAVFTAAAAVSFFSALNFAELLSGTVITLLYAASSIAFCTAVSESVHSARLSFFLSACVLAGTNGIQRVSSLSIRANPLRSLTFYRHFISAAHGIIDTRSIFFYLILSALFIALAHGISEFKKGRKIKKSRAALMAFCFALAFIDAERLYVRFDAAGQRALSPYTKGLLQTADEPITLSYYRNAAVSALFPQALGIRDSLLEFALDENVVVQQFDADEYAPLLKNYGIEPYQAESAAHGKRVLTDVYSAVVIEYKGMWEAAPLILSADRLEYEITQRLSKLLSARKLTVNLVAGNGMDFSDAYGAVIPFLNEQGFVCREVSYEDDALFERLKAGGNVTAIFGSDKMTAKQAAAIEAYILDGGNVFFAASPFSADLGSWHIERPDSNPLIDMLEFYGFGFSENLIADTQCARLLLTARDENENGAQTRGMAHTELINYPLWIQPLDKDGYGVTLFWAAAVEPLTEQVQPILSASAASWLLPRTNRDDGSLFQTNPFYMEELYEKAEPRSARGTAFLLEGAVSGFYQRGERKHTTLVLIPDQYFLASALLDYTSGGYSAYQNLHFLTEQLLRLGGADELAALLKKSLRGSAHAFYKTPDEASFLAARKKAFFLLFLYAPIGIALLRLCVSLLRRRHIRALLQNCDPANGGTHE